MLPLPSVVLRFVLGCLAGVLFVALQQANAQDPEPQKNSLSFIRIVDTQFLEGEKPFYFVGANLNVMHEPKVRALASKTLNAAVQDGLRVGRIWALGEGLPDAPEWQKKDYLFRNGPDGWQETAFLQLDRVIAMAEARGIRLIITLSNAWADYGGIPMYLRWAGHVDVESYGYRDRFFADKACRTWFAEHVKRVVGRRNSVTGRLYRDDPTIFAWELQNEMNGTPEAAPDREQWVIEMSRLIRKLDPNHLVVPGTLGYYLQKERTDWIRMNRLKEVSYCDHHAYPEEHLQTQREHNLRLFIDERVQLAHYAIGKPIVFGEFGFGGKGNKRARAHQRFLERIFYDGGNGALVWIYQITLPWERVYPILVDRKQYLPLRNVLKDVSRQIVNTEVRLKNPRLGPSLGESLIAPTHALMTRTALPHKGWKRIPNLTRGPVRLEIPVDQFYRAWFEEAGSWDQGILVHAYGRRTGWIEYQFTGPAFVPAHLKIRARLSSEFPGSAAPKHGISEVQVLINDLPITRLTVPPDDGVGRWFSMEITDPKLLQHLRGGKHRLRFSVEAGPHANGVAILGRESTLNRDPVEDPGPIELIAHK